MESFFTAKIYHSEPEDLIFTKFDTQLVPLSDDVDVYDVASYWKSCVLRRREYPKGNYSIVVTLSRSRFVAIVCFTK